MADHCTHEHDVVASVLGRRWNTAPDDLKRHADDCAICSEVVAVADLLSADQARARSEVRVPAAGQVWWRAAVRARLDAAQAVARPLTLLHGIAGAVALGLAVTAVGMVWPSVLEIASWFASHAPGADTGMGGMAALVTAAVQRSLTLSLVVAACIVLTPIALYFVLSDD